MSGHPREQLSALLDGELGTDQQAELQAHVAACAQCAAELEELALVGQATRELDEPPPEGYFDALPGRIRERVRSARRTTARPARRLLPGWSWAAAAAVLLAVLLPILWQRQASLQPPAPTARVAPRQQEQEQEPQPAEQPPAASAPAFQGAPALEPPRPAGAETKPREALKKQAVAEEKVTAQPAAPAPPVPGAPARRLETGPGFAAAPAPASSAAPQEHDLAAVGYVDGRLGESLPAADAEPAADRGAGALERQRRASREAGLAKGQAAPAAGAAESRTREGGRVGDKNEEVRERAGLRDELAARPPATAAEARSLARQWLRQAERQADPVLADEARLRALEALAAALRLSGSASDRSALERAVAAYLARADALQKPRAERLLE